jgi:predicted metalloprotease
MDRLGTARQGPTGGSVRLELQADCYAGVWAKNAVATGFYEKPFTRTDIDEALSAASAVGDDRIQKKAQGRVDPESFTHGTSAQRVKWFTTGYRTGSPGRCDTFSGGI